MPPHLARSGQGGGGPVRMSGTNPREEEGAGPSISPAPGRRRGQGRSVWANRPEFWCGDPREEERGRRFSDRLREEEEPLELMWSGWTEFYCGDPGEEDRGRRFSERPQGGGGGPSYHLGAFAPE